jgi:hypothetical protein
LEVLPKVLALMPSASHLIEDRTVSLVNPSPLGLPSSRDLHHRPDVHPGQLAPLNHLDSDLKARRGHKQEGRERARQTRRRRVPHTAQ